MSNWKYNLFFYQLMSHIKDNNSLPLYQLRHKFIKKMCWVLFFPISRNTVELNEIMEIVNKDF